MKIISYKHLRDFEFWGPAKENILKLTLEELDYLDNYFDEGYPEGVEEVWLNDAFAYYFDDILDILGEVEH